MHDDNAKRRLWDEFLEANRVAEESVPLFATSNKLIATIEYGRNKRRVLSRSQEMTDLMRGLGKSLCQEFESGKITSSGILYLMFRQVGDKVIPLYFGKAELLGKSDNLSANISDLKSGNGKFGRWGYNYAYHMGDLSAATLEGHPKEKKTRKYADWNESLFETIEGDIYLRGDIRFWACTWNPNRKSIWSSYGSTKLAFEEYLLIGVTSDLFPQELLNREGRNS